MISSSSDMRPMQSSRSEYLRGREERQAWEEHQECVLGGAAMGFASGRSQAVESSTPHALEHTRASASCRQPGSCRARTALQLCCMARAAGSLVQVEVDLGASALALERRNVVRLGGVLLSLVASCT